MSYYFPDLIDGIHVDAEQKRYANFKFAPLRRGRASETATSGRRRRSPDSSRGSAGRSAIGAGPLLAEGDHQIALQDAAAAIATFEKVLAKYPDNARANFGLAVASLLNHDADRAQELFEKLVSAAPPLGG